MLPSTQELFIVVLLLALFFFLPRFFFVKKKNEIIFVPKNEKKNKLMWKSRLFIVLSLIWLSSFMIYMKPWVYDPSSYIILGIGPVALFWSLCWIKAGK